MSSPVKSQTINVSLTSKNVLTLEEVELYELSQLAGVTLEPATFKIILDLLKMNVSPQAVLQMLKTMCLGRKRRALASSKSSDKGSSQEGENMPPPRPRPSSKTRNTSSSSRRTDARR